MPTKTVAYRTTICLIWGLALWHTWESRGLFVDGSAFLVQIARRGWFFDFYGPRLYAMVLGQMPVITGVFLGVTDLHLLARLLSLGLFALPTALYHLALARAKDDAVLLATVIAAIAVVFMTTSFFIVGEYNTAYAIAILVAVRLATASDLTVLDGLFLAVIGVLGMRTYEAMLYLGPLLAAMIAWRVWRAPARPWLPMLLHGLSAVGFMIGMGVAIRSLARPYSVEHLDETIETASNFWQNLQFDLVLSAAIVVVLWALIRPRDLLRGRPYWWASIGLLLLALCPLLVLGDTLVRPLAKSQYVARSAAGLVIAAMVVFIWAYASNLRLKLPAFTALADGRAAARFMAFALLMLFATLPSDIYLTRNWTYYLDTMRAAVRSQPGVIAFEDSPLARHPFDLLVEAWILPSQSLALRGKQGDGIIAPPKDFKRWQPFPPADPYPLGQFVWRE
ncbi:MAG: hypothetical protein JOY64_24785 [Alphaproteobacteria bacterium]|nr:hypothetical protein [Alphaproteobacteria bacterium]MBV8410867.1 hypothetical protein [Alphaproteobacteria bacterium]